MIRRVEESDRDIYIEFVSEFYRSDAVLHAIPKENMEKTFDELMSSDYKRLGYSELGYCQFVKEQN